MGEAARVCLVSAEVTPFAKTGGLGDAVAGLTRYLARAGHDARLIAPLYSSIDTSGRGFEVVEFARDVPVDCGAERLTFSLVSAPLPDGGPRMYFIHCPPLYDRPSIYTGGEDDALRMAFLARAAIEACQRMGWSPQVFHCNDWHAALLPLYLRTHYGWDNLFSATRTLLTIHNIGYQGVFDSGVLGQLDLAEHANLLPREDVAAGRINFLRTGCVYATALSTVSPTHAREIQTAEYGSGLESLLQRRSGDLVGILNGVDTDEWNPATDPLIPHHYDCEDLTGKIRNKEDLLHSIGLGYRPETPLVGIVTRLTKQKGIDLLRQSLPWFLSNHDMQLVAVGSGDREYETMLGHIALSFPGRAYFYRGYNNQLAHWVEAGSDIFLMPSLYEPCGLNQMYSLRYGTVPVVRRTGGLADSVRDYDWLTGQGTGFVFDDYNHEGLGWALGSALETWRHPEAWTSLVRRGMAEDFSWDRQGLLYLDLYRRLAGA
ncbi:MAG: glycogen synthase [Acidobacteriota bacterium]